MRQVVIREATEGDLPDLLTIYNDVILNTTAVFSEQSHTLQMRTDWYNDRINNNFPVYVAQLNGQVAGFSSYGHFRAWSCYRYTVEVSVYVAEPFRGHGLSRLLLASLVNCAAKNNMHAVIAGITADNHISINLHQSFGFKEVANFKEVGYKFGRWLDVKFFELILPINPAHD